MCAASAAALGHLPALAQSAQAGSAPGGDQLQDIIVTAQKKSENLQNTPVAITALSSSDVADRGINSPVQLQEIVPAVRFIPADQMSIMIRGLGTTNVNPGVDSSVAYSQDGIYLAHPEALSPIMYDMQRVEVVLGPQGTLYGRNSNGGVVNFISNAPTNQFGGYATVGGGNYSAVNAEAAINLPLNESWAMRVAGAYAKHGPYDSDGSNNQDATAGRVKLLYSPTSSPLTAMFTVDGSRNDGVGNMYGAICPPGVAANIPACVGVPYTPWSGLLPASQQYNRVTVFGAAADIEYDLQWAKLTSLTGYKTYNFHGDTSAPWYGGYDHFDYEHTDQSRFFTQEFRLASNTDSKVSWVTGVFYSREQQPTTVNFLYHDTILQALYGAPPNTYESLKFVSTLYQSEALFGDITVPLTDDFRFRGGARLTHESKDAAGLVTSGVGQTETGTPLYNAVVETLTKPTWKAGFDYDLTSKNMLYVTVSTGFKSGGVNNLPSASGMSTYAPETILAYEFGSKNRFLDDRVQLNASVFRYDYKGYQTYLPYAPTSGPLAGTTLFPTVNSQSSTYQGGEIQALVLATPVDKISVNMNFLDNRYNTFVVTLPGASTYDQSGREVGLSPKATYTLAYDHTFNLPNGDTLNLAANSLYSEHQLVSGTYGDNLNYVQPAYHKSGANLTYHSSNNWTVRAYVRNIENKATINVIQNGYPVGAQANEVNVMLDPPRTYGGEISKQF